MRHPCLGLSGVASIAGLWQDNVGMLYESPAPSRKLRFGTIVPRDRTVEEWQAQALRHLAESGAAELALCIVDAAAETGRQPLFWRAFRALCRPRALQRRRIDAAGVPEVSLAQGAATIAAHDLDCIVSFTGTVPAQLPASARHGVWFFDHGADASYRSAPPCFWEIHDGTPVMTGCLRRRTQGEDAGTILRLGHLKTIDYSYARSADQFYSEVARWPAYAARELAFGVARNGNAPPVENQARQNRRFSAAAVLRFLRMLAQNTLRRLVERAHYEEWNIGIASIRPEELVNGAEIGEVAWLPPVRGGWVADPMARESDGKVHVLCEEMSLQSGKGRISQTTFDGSSWSSLEPAIVTQTHASYPYLFERRGEIFCVPETFEANEAALYRAREFPNGWERVATLMTGISAVDGTLFEHDGRWWFFCTTSEGSNTALFGFFADDVFGPWRPHFANPLKIDVRSARPAGAPFCVGGQLYRPAQDSSLTYGGRIVIHRIVALTPYEFREEPHRTVEPLPSTRYGRGLHTISFADAYCVVDGKRFVRRPLLPQLAKGLGRMGLSGVACLPQRLTQ